MKQERRTQFPSSGTWAEAADPGGLSSGWAHRLQSLFFHHIGPLLLFWVVAPSSSSSRGCHPVEMREQMASTWARGISKKISNFDLAIFFLPLPRCGFCFRLKGQKNVCCRSKEQNFFGGASLIFHAVLYVSTGHRKEI